MRAFDVARSATAMGPVCPFAYASAQPDDSSLPLVFETAQPLMSEAECQMVIDETSAAIAAGTAGSTFTLRDTSRNMAVAKLPKTLAFLNEEGLPRVAALAGECFGEAAIGDPRKLRLYRALVVHYDAAAGLTHQTVHRDHSLVTCVVTLNARDEYTGGGTWLEDLGVALSPPRGHAVMQASALRHAGHAIESGERWALVLFMVSEEMKYGEHVRHLTARAYWLLEMGDKAGAMECITLARAMCDDSDVALRDYAIAYGHTVAPTPATMQAGRLGR